MRLRLALFCLLVVWGSAARSETIKVTDTLAHTSKADDLLGGRTKSTTIVVSRVVARPVAKDGPWTITYDRMTADDLPIQGAQGRTYSVSLVDGVLKVEPVAPTDQVGLAGVIQDLASLRPVFEAAPLCQQDDAGLCPALDSLLRRFGEPKLKKKNDGLLAIEIKTPEGEKLEGTVRLEAQRWTVELDAVRRESISYNVEGGQSKEASAMMSGHDELVREFTTLP